MKDLDFHLGLRQFLLASRYALGRPGFFPVAVVVASLLSVMPDGLARAADPHELFEARCTACHGHAGGFARETLVIVADEILGAESGRDIQAFLPGHRGGLTPEETASLLDMFWRQISSSGLFLTRCRSCHESARALARQRLVARDGQLLGRYSGRDITVFLQRHGRTTTAEQQLLYETLLWQLEVAGLAN